MIRIKLKYKRFAFATSIFLFSFFKTISVYGQEKNTLANDAIWVQKDLPQVIREALDKPPVSKSDEKGSLLLIPIVASNPATGFMVGVGGQYALKLKGSDRYSSFNGSTQFTSKGQKMFFVKNSIYTRDNKFYFNGDWRFMIFSQPTYGLGTDAPEGGILDYQFGLGGIETTADSLAQPMKFNHAKIYQTVSMELTKNLYAGIGYNFDSYTKIDDEKLSLVTGDTLLTSHYVYNKYYGFATDRYFSSAVNLSLTFDSRDNMINPYKGYYAMASWRGGLKLLGNKENTSYWQLEYRSYHSLSKNVHRHLIAFWLMGNFAPDGEFPYMILPATGYDQRGRSGRGYVQGRYRGNNFVYGETEYRFPLSRKGGVLGGVVFVNATTADNPVKKLHLFDSVKPGYGFGLRIMADKRSRTNLALDFGFGENSGGFYLAASETF
ncbi:MAG TPA: BamA/TamA family outer membrane protein [Draconibacterium sp.]|jgi:hypothetical protein|nr:BamA/TamA family outer membrane protein [Draconibacterium sp.]